MGFRIRGCLCTFSNHSIPSPWCSQHRGTRLRSQRRRPAGLNAHRYRTASARSRARVDHRGIGIHTGGCGVQIQVRKIRVGKIPVRNVNEGRVRVSQRRVRPRAAFRRNAYTGRTGAFLSILRIVPRMIVFDAAPGWVQTELSLKNAAQVLQKSMKHIPAMAPPQQKPKHRKCTGSSLFKDGRNLKDWGAPA